MKKTTNDLSQLKSKDPGFSVPENYFGNFRVPFPGKKENNRLPRETGMQVPDGYFENLTDRIKTNVEQNLIPRENGMKTPENYFENFKVPLPKKEIRVIDLFKRYAAGISTLAAAAVMLFYLGVRTPDFSPAANDLANLSNEELEGWLETNSDELNPEDIAEAFDDIQLDSDIAVSENDIINYLEDKDIESLLNEN